MKEKIKTGLMVHPMVCSDDYTFTSSKSFF